MTFPVPKLRRTALACLGLSVSAVLLSACGGSGGSDSPASVQLPVQPAPQPPAAAPQQASITLLAGRLGQEELKNVDGAAANARIVLPEAITADAAGNIYVATLEKTLRKVAPNGMVSTLEATAAHVAVDQSGNVWLADGAQVRRMAPGGAVTLVADLSKGLPVDPATGQARTVHIGAITIGPDGSAYVADVLTVRKVTSAGAVSLVAGSIDEYGLRDGVGANARLSAPRAITADSAGNLYVTEQNAVRRITANGTVTTIAGGERPGAFADGNGAAARFDEPIGVVADKNGNVYVADTANHVIRRIAPDGAVTTLVGQAGKPGAADGTGAAATLYFPVGLALDRDGNLLVTERGNHLVRRVTLSGAVTTVVGKPLPQGPDDGIGSAARFNQPGPLAVDEAGNLYVADVGNSTVRKVAPDGTVTTLAGRANVFKARDGVGRTASFGNVTGISVDKAGTVFVSDASGCYRKMSCTAGGLDDASSLVRKISATGTVTSLAGIRMSDTSVEPPVKLGTGLAADISWPSGLVLDPGGSLYVANCGTKSLFKVGQDGAVSKLVDDVCQVVDPSSTTSATAPKGMVRDAQGNIYLTESATSRIAKISPDFKITWIGRGSPWRGATDGTAAEATFDYPQGIAIDSKGNLYVADTGSEAIRKIAADGTVSTFAGKAGAPGVKLGVLPGGLTKPAGIAIDSKDMMYISTENAIIKVQLNK